MSLISAGSISLDSTFNETPNSKKSNAGSALFWDVGSESASKQEGRIRVLVHASKSKAGSGSGFVAKWKSAVEAYNETKEAHPGAMEVHNGAGAP